MPAGHRRTVSGELSPQRSVFRLERSAESQVFAVAIPLIGINEMVRRRAGLRLGSSNEEDHLCTSHPSASI
jgi:hypothetical protein